MQFTEGLGRGGFAVKQRGCLTLTWRGQCRGSLCRSCVLSGRRCCSSPAPLWWRTRCRRPNAGRPNGFLRCCRTGCCADSSVSSELPGPECKWNINITYYILKRQCIYHVTLTFELMVYNPTSFKFSQLYQKTLHIPVISRLQVLIAVKFYEILRFCGRKKKKGFSLFEKAMEMTEHGCFLAVNKL